MGDIYFIDNLKRKNVVIIFPPSIFKLTNDFNCLKTIESCSVSLEKADSYNLVQLRLMDLNDPTKLFICTIDNFLYEQIKNEQSLHVSFPDFVSHLTAILQSCQKNELLMSLIKDEQKCILQIYERRSFRNLIHLYLPMKQAPIETILFHINASNISNQNQLKQFSNQNQRLEQELTNRDEHISQLRNDIKRLNEVINEKDNMVFNRNCEEINKLQHTIKHLQDSKDTDEKKYKLMMSQLQEQIENVKKENLNLNEKLKQETFKTATLRDEVNSFKLNNTNIRERNERLQTELISYQNRDKKHEMAVNENRRLIQELNEKLKQYEKKISEFRAELEAEKNICNTKKNALKIATEEIAKANGIIVKQSKEIREIQKEIDNRTEVALKQEMYIKKKETENVTLGKKLHQVQDEFYKCNEDHKDFAVTFKKLQDNVQHMEQKYKLKIEELQGRILIECRSNSARPNDYQRINKAI